MDRSRYGVHVHEAALAWLVVSIAGTLIPTFLTVGLFFLLDVDAPWLLLGTVAFAGSFFASLAVLYFLYLFGVEEMTVWHDLLIVALVTAGLLTLDMVVG